MVDIVRADYENHTDKLVLVSSSDCCFDLLLILSSKNIQKLIGNIQGDFFNWYPPKKLKYVKPWLGVSTLT